MKEFDEIIGGKFGILKGGKNLVFIKTGRGGTIFGYGNKYLKICNLLYEKYGCTFVVSANPIDSLCDLEDEIRQIGEYVGEYDEIYFVGVSNGANVGAQQCWKIDKIKNALLINGPIMINWHKTKSGAEKFKGEQIRFVYGDQDPSFQYVEILEYIENDVCTYVTIKKEGHVLSGTALESVIFDFFDERMH